MSALGNNASMRSLVEEVAVVGISCRFPGSDTPEDLWKLLKRANSAVSYIPDGRWDNNFLRGLRESESQIIQRGGFLADVAGFDAEFFNVSPREAAMMDPQQRLLLELSWEAIEDAGIRAQQLSEARAGVFVGVGGDDYSTLVREQGPDGVSPHTFTGSLRSIIANRVSYFLRATGPSLVVDAGQASSLVALHLAADSLRKGDSDVAIAGGVTLRLTPHHSLAAHRFGALSPDGQCHVFDARANGFAQGEGGGAVVLKRLQDALADGDAVYCVIRGSAVNNDSGGSQLAEPSARAQAAVIREAHRLAGSNPRDVAYVELHGTGTKAGDPVEAAALAEAIGSLRQAGSPLRVGSIKSNIGHLEAAAGIAGFIKTALCIRSGTLVPTAGFRTPNPYIPLDELNLHVQTSVEEVELDEPTLLGVSSFGVGGTNCHMVLSAAPAAAGASGHAGSTRPASLSSSPPVPLAGTQDVPVPLLLSATSATALQGQAARLSEWLRTDAGSANAVDLGWALLTTRSVWNHRAVVMGAVGDDIAAAAQGLEALAVGEPSELVRTGRAVPPVKPVFVFPGQGSQWLGMATDLIDASPAFAAALQECADALAPHIDWDLRHALRGGTDAPDLERVDIVQPALWAVMISLTR
ncbi:type I polyketide synthase, partial [Streptomyces sp. NPDC102437]|uniref:type I polyketide synthase n=1 Tax=Streptomyces sp. NPDC102437 TaxID=3366175 RepID=UPI003800C61F